jgi:hypothetical protein
MNLSILYSTAIAVMSINVSFTPEYIHIYIIYVKRLFNMFNYVY